MEAYDEVLEEGGLKGLSQSADKSHSNSSHKVALRPFSWSFRLPFEKKRPLKRHCYTDRSLVSVSENSFEHLFKPASHNRASTSKAVSAVTPPALAASRAVRQEPARPQIEAGWIQHSYSDPAPPYAPQPPPQDGQFAPAKWPTATPLRTRAGRWVYRSHGASRLLLYWMILLGFMGLNIGGGVILGNSFVPSSPIELKRSNGSNANTGVRTASRSIHTDTRHSVADSFDHNFVC